jgi:hypothetical protein
MALTFRSTGQETKIVIDRAPDGRQRVGRAVQSAHNEKFWNITIENPSGDNTPATFCGTGLEAVVAIADLMNRGAREYELDRQRGDARRATMQRDRNIRLDENGNALGNSAVKNYLKQT